MSWIVVKTVPRREAEVAKALELLGWVVWIPVYLRASRKRFASASGVVLRKQKIKELPLLPGYFVAKSHESINSMYAARIEHFEGVWTDAYMNVRRIPDCQIEAFCDRVESINAKTRKRLEEKEKKKEKAKTFRLSEEDPEDIKRELLAVLFGKQEQEAA